MQLKNILLNNFLATKKIFSSLHSRNYRNYFVGQGISLIGTWMQNIALSWLVYRITGSVFLLGLIGFTSQIPTFFLSPFTGVLTDRYNKLKLLTFTQVSYMILALVMTLLVMLNLIQVWHIVVLSILSGVITSLDSPTRQSLVICLVDDPADLGNAIALNSAIFNGARLIGPAIAGLTIAAVGEGICFLLNTLSFVAVLIAISRIKIVFNHRESGREDFKKSFSEGFHYTFSSVPIRTLIVILAILSTIGMPFIVLLPAYAKETLGGGSDTLGYLMSGLGAGALAGALYMASRKSVLGLTKIIATHLTVMGLAISLVAFSSSFWISIIIFSFGGLSMIMSLSSINTMLQTLADDDKRGRVMSFYAMALMGTAPIGNLIAGSVASGIGIRYTLLLCGLIVVASGLWFSMSRKRLRKHIRPIYVTKGILPSIPDDLT
jgi:MFS family permease